MVQDVKKAYFYADATRDVYVDLPPERAQPGMCAILYKTLYGTRDAALNWAKAYSDVMEKLGFVKGRSSPCSFYHAEWRVRTVVHGNDFVSEGPDASLREMDKAMKKVFSLKAEIMSGDPGAVKKLKILIRQLSWNKGEILWEADPRHIEILANKLGLTNGKASRRPAIRTTQTKHSGTGVSTTKMGKLKVRLPDR